MALVCYVFAKPFGANKEGDQVQLDPEEAQALVDAGVIAEATADDIGGEEVEEVEEYAEQDAALCRAFDRFGKNLVSTVASVVEKVQSKGSVAPAIPAQPKQAVFKGVGEFLATLASAKNSSAAQRRLEAYSNEVRKKSPAGGNEGNVLQGGYFLKPEWYKEVWDRIHDYPKLLDMTDRNPISGNTFNIPVITEAGTADGSRHGGVRAYYVGEAVPGTASYPATNNVQAVLTTPLVLVPATNILLQDSNVESYSKKITELALLEILWQQNQAVVAGAGTTQPVGILNQPALVTVTKSSNDSAGMFGFRDLVNMFKVMYPGSRRNATWLMHPACYNSVLAMVFEPATGSATTYPAFGGISYNASDEVSPLRIFGKPVIECLNCSNPGLPGDILLADLKQLVTAEHPEIYADVSTDFSFNTLETYFRFYYRFDIRSPWTTTYLSGGVNFSPFVALQSRGT